MYNVQYIYEDRLSTERARQLIHATTTTTNRKIEVSPFGRENQKSTNGTHGTNYIVERLLHSALYADHDEDILRISGHGYAYIWL